MTLKLKRLEKELAKKDEEKEKALEKELAKKDEEKEKALEKALEEKEKEYKEMHNKMNKKMQDMADAIRAGINFITREQDWSSQLSQKISASKVGQLVKRSARTAGLDYPSSGSDSFNATPKR